MRVLGATFEYPPKSRVGAWLATHQYLRHLVACGHEVAVVPFRTIGKPWEVDGVTVTPGGLSVAKRAAADADVVVSHYGDGGVGAKIASRTGRPSVQFVHGGIHKVPASADLIVFNSRTTAALVDHGGRGIVCRPPTIAADHVVSSTGDEVTIVNLSAAKGIRTAWRVSERCDRRFLGVLGGYGEQRKPRTGNWSFLPVQQDMRVVWTRTRVLLMPSEYETWGMVGVEAMTNGIPVIAHPAPGLVESLGSAGIFCDRDDTDEWLAALDRLDDPGEYAAASSAAKARAAQLDPQADLERFRLALEAM